MQDVNRSLDDVFQGGHVRKQVEALKDETNLRTNTTDIGLAILHQATIDFTIADKLAFNVNTPIVNLFQVVDTAEEGGFTGAAGTDDDDDLSTLDGQVDA